MTALFLLHPWVLWGTPLVIAAVAAGYFWARRTRRRRLALFLTTQQAAKAMQWSQERWRVLGAALTALALALVWGALSRPLSGPRPDETRARGIDAYVLLDCSKSMLVTDVTPDRLEFAKSAIKKWRETLVGDRLGLVLIGGDAFVAIPPTLGAESFNYILGKVAYSYVQGGSHLARGIEAAVEDLVANQKDGKYAKPVILLFSDGGQTSGDAIAAARTAWETHRIPVHCIGTGTTAGGRVPRTSGQYRTAVTSRLEEAPLRAIAKAGGGTYIHLAGASGAEAGAVMLDRLYREQLAPLSTLSGSMEIEDYYEWFQVPLLLALLLLATEPYVRNRTRPVLQEPEVLPVVLPVMPSPESLSASRHQATPLRRRLQNLTSANVLIAALSLPALWFGAPGPAFAAVDHAHVEALVVNKNYDEAERMLRDALVAEAGNLELSYNLGIVSYARARSAEEAAGTDGAARARQGYLEAIERFQPALSAPDPALVNRALFQLGTVKIRLGALLARRDVNGAAGGADAIEEAIRSYQSLEGTSLHAAATRNTAQAVVVLETVAISYATQKLTVAGEKPAGPRRLADQNGAYAEAWAMLQRLARYKPESAEAKKLQREIGQRWAVNLCELARPLEAEAERLFALPTADGKAGRSPKWADAIKAQGRALDLLEKAFNVAPNDAEVSACYSLAKARLVGELLDAVRDTTRSRANAYDVLAGVATRHLEMAERYAGSDDPRVAQVRQELLAAMENAAVLEGDKLVGEFERQREKMERAPPAHSRLAAMKGATMEAKTATVLSRGMEMYAKALDLNADNAHALAQRGKYAPELAEAFAGMGRSELEAAKAIASRASPAAAAQAEDALSNGAQESGGEPDATNLATAQLEKAMSHLENANNGFSQAQGMGLDAPALQALQSETSQLLAELRSRYEAQNQAAGQSSSQGQGGNGGGGDAENVGGKPVESYARHFARTQKAKSNYDSKAAGGVEKDW